MNVLTNNKLNTNSTSNNSNSININKILKDCYYLKKESIIAKSKLEQLTLYSSPSYEERVQGGTGSNQTESKLYKRCEMIQKYEAILDQYNARVLQAHSYIDQIDEGAIRLVLKMYYIDGESMESISCKLAYSYRHTCRLRQKGLLLLKKIVTCPKMSYF